MNKIEVHWDLVIVYLPS